jgi:tetratricopeptide (TPR) repeat protein
MSQKKKITVRRSLPPGFFESLTAPRYFLILIFLGGLVYSNAWHSSFIFDDFRAIVTNEAIRHPGNLSAIFNAFNTRFVLGVTLAFNYALGGLDVRGYHALNIVIHILSSFLVYSLVQLYFKTPAGSLDTTSHYRRHIGFFASLLFLTHPIQTQAVTYIWQRAASLAACFYLASVFLYVRARLNFSWKSYLGSLGSALLCLFTKEISLTLPLAIVAAEFFFWKRDNGDFLKRILRLAPFFLLLVVALLTLTRAESVTLPLLRPDHSAAGQSGTLLPKWLDTMTRNVRPEIMSRKAYYFTQLNVVGTYFRLLFLPVNQNLDYDYPLSFSIAEPRTLYSLFFIIAVVFVGLKEFRTSRLAAYGLFWFFLTLSIESLVVQADVIFEHRLYLPMAGFTFFIVTALFQLFQNKPAKYPVAILIMLIGLCSVLTYQRNLIWRDELSLWSDVIRKSPGKEAAYNNRGNAYYDRKMLNEALLDFTKAIEINPRSVKAHNNLGNIYLGMGLADKAILNFSKAIQIDPRYAPAYNNRANALCSRGLYDLAVIDYTKAIEITPRSAELLYNRGLSHLMNKNYPAALEDLTSTIRINPDYVNAYASRAMVYFYLGRYDQSWEDVRRSRELGAATDSKFLNQLMAVSKQVR